MIFVGIDVSSTKHDIAIISCDGEVLSKSLTIPNDLDGFKKLRKDILSHAESDVQIHIGIEETGIYSKNISEFLALCGFNVHMINPILTSNSRKAQSVRPTKTDSIDALAICQYLAFNYKRLNSYIPSLYIYEEIKSLSRARIDIQHKLVKSKTEWARLLDLTFPEFKKVFKYQAKWVYSLFVRYPTAEKIARAHVDSLEVLIAAHGDHQALAVKLKQIAKDTVGNNSPVNNILIKNVLNDIFHYTKQMDELEKVIEELIVQNFSNILTVPGVGIITAGLIIGEIGDINRFNSPSALLAYAGLDPATYESGNFKAKNVRISKRGSRYLRTAIFTSTKMACINNKICDNKFRQKYQKKICQGKHHFSSVCHFSKNMVNVIYRLLKTGENFNYNI